MEVFQAKLRPHDTAHRWIPGQPLVLGQQGIKLFRNRLGNGGRTPGSHVNMRAEILESRRDIVTPFVGHEVHHMESLCAATDQAAVDGNLLTDSDFGQIANMAFERERAAVRLVRLIPVKTNHPE